MEISKYIFALRPTDPNISVLFRDQTAQACSLVGGRVLYFAYPVPIEVLDVLTPEELHQFYQHLEGNLGLYYELAGNFRLIYWQGLMSRILERLHSLGHALRDPVPSTMVVRGLLDDVLARENIHPEAMATAYDWINEGMQGPPPFPLTEEFYYPPPPIKRISREGIGSFSHPTMHDPRYDCYWNSVNQIDDHYLWLYMHGDIELAPVEEDEYWYGRPFPSRGNVLNDPLPHPMAPPVWVEPGYIALEERKIDIDEARRRGIDTHWFAWTQRELDEGLDAIHRDQTNHLCSDEELQLREDQLSLDFGDKLKVLQANWKHYNSSNSAFHQRWERFKQDTFECVHQEPLPANKRVFQPDIHWDTNSELKEKTSAQESGMQNAPEDKQVQHKTIKGHQKLSSGIAINTFPAEQDLQDLESSALVATPEGRLVGKTPTDQSWGPQTMWPYRDSRSRCIRSENFKKGCDEYFGVDKHAKKTEPKSVSPTSHLLYEQSKRIEERLINLGVTVEQENTKLLEEEEVYRLVKFKPKLHSLLGENWRPTLTERARERVNSIHTRQCFKVLLSSFRYGISLELEESFVRFVEKLSDEEVVLLLNKGLFIDWSTVDEWLLVCDPTMAPSDEFEWEGLEYGLVDPDAFIDSLTADEWIGYLTGSSDLDTYAKGSRLTDSIIAEILKAVGSGTSKKLKRATVHESQKGPSRKNNSYTEQGQSTRGSVREGVKTTAGPSKQTPLLHSHSNSSNSSRDARTNINLQGSSVPDKGFKHDSASKRTLPKIPVPAVDTSGADFWTFEELDSLNRANTSKKSNGKAKAKAKVEEPPQQPPANTNCEEVIRSFLKDAENAQLTGAKPPPLDNDSAEIVIDFFKWRANDTGRTEKKPTKKVQRSHRPVERIKAYRAESARFRDSIHAFVDRQLVGGGVPPESPPRAAWGAISPERFPAFAGGAIPPPLPTFERGSSVRPKYHSPFYARERATERPEISVPASRHFSPAPSAWSESMMRSSDGSRVIRPSSCSACEKKEKGKRPAVSRSASWVRIVSPPPIEPGWNFVPEDLGEKWERFY